MLDEASGTQKNGEDRWLSLASAHLPERSVKAYCLLSATHLHLDARLQLQGFGPAMFGYVAQYAGWRWIEWIQMIMAGATAVIVLVCFRETRGSVILSRRAAKLRKETGLDYRCRADEERATLLILIKTGVSRPIWFFFTEPIGEVLARPSSSFGYWQLISRDLVLSLSIWVGFAWGALYGVSNALRTGLQSLMMGGYSWWRRSGSYIKTYTVGVSVLLGWPFWLLRMFWMHEAFCLFSKIDVSVQSRRIRWLFRQYLSGARLQAIS